MDSLQFGHLEQRYDEDESSAIDTAPPAPLELTSHHATAASHKGKGGRKTALASDVGDSYHQSTRKATNGSRALGIENLNKKRNLWMTPEMRDKMIT